jgi:hypothetical protein
MTYDRHAPLRRPGLAALRLVGPLVLATSVVACGPGGGGGDQCTGILAGELVITEIFADAAAPPGGSGADDGREWFEIFNASTRTIDLEGVTLVHTRPDGSRQKVHVMDPLTIPAGSYAVLGNVLPEFVTDHLDYGYANELGDLFNTNGGALTIRCGGEVIDRALYDAVASGRSTGFDGGIFPDYTANDDLTLWCTTPNDPDFEFAPNNFGTPGGGNYDCITITSGMCDDGTGLRPTMSPVAGDLVITEVHPSPSGDDAVQEWFEAYAVNGFDLNGVGLDRAGDNLNPNVITGEPCLTVAAGTYLVFARSRDPELNGALPRVDGLFRFSLVGTGDVRILDPAGGVLDAVTWTGATNNVSRQLDPDFFDVTGNDDEATWCNSTLAWAGGDRGSPGAANEECLILPPPGRCIDPDTQLERDIVEPGDGQLVITEWMPNPSLVTDANGEWFEVRATAAIDLNGLQAGAASLGASPIVVSVACVELAAGDRALLARKSDPEVNGMLPPVDGTFSFSLANTSGQLRIGVGDVELDVVAWTSSVAARSIQIDDAGRQCNAPAGTGAYNGTDVGTPDEPEDVACPAP